MKIIISVLCFLVLVSCASVPQKAGKFTDVGVWQGRAFFLNTKKKSKRWASVVWASDSSVDQLRIDVYTIFDIPLATFIKLEEKTHLWIFDEKKYYFSKNGKKLFDHLTKIPLDPNVFFKLLGDPQKLNARWQCQQKKDVSECLSREDETRFLIQYESHDQRTIQVKKGPKTLRLELHRAKVQVSDDDFKLPQGLQQYEKIHL